MNPITPPNQPEHLDAPLKLALIGAGHRSRTVYAPLVESLKPWVDFVAVCDPIAAHADALADRLGCAAFHDIRELVHCRPMEAALAVTPPDSHHSISCFLSQHRVHNLIETPIASTLEQARQMVDTARDHEVMMRVAENFIRTPVDRLVQKIVAAGVVGAIHRVFSYADHTGYHNNSRWLRFAGGYPEWVQSVQHTMPVATFEESPQRHHEHETFDARFFMFADGYLVTDQAANPKGFLGRHPRPGYTEWQGERGTIVHRATSDHWGLIDGAEVFVRRCTDRALKHGHGFSDETFTATHDFDEGGRWLNSRIDTPGGCIEHVNPYRPRNLCEVGVSRGEYGSSIMDHLVDFALTVRGKVSSEFDDNDALMAMMMEVGAHESSLRQGQRVALPLSGDLEADHLSAQRIRDKHRIDPCDIQAMLAISYPKP